MISLFNKKISGKIKKKVKKIVKQKKIFEDILNFYKSSLTELDDIKDLFELAQSESNDEIINDCNQKIDKIKKDIKDKEINCFLSGENDDLSIYLEIHAGAGGTESQDWANMLRRMYLKWFDKKILIMKLLANIGAKRQELNPQQ